MADLGARMKGGAVTLERSPLTAAKYERTSFSRKRFPDSVPISAIEVLENGGGDGDGDDVGDKDLDAKLLDCCSEWPNRFMVFQSKFRWKYCNIKGLSTSIT
jgi:hypothetical protein